MAAALGNVPAGDGAPEAIVIRRFGRSAARGRALQERRQIAAETPADVGRLTGVCSHCARSHSFPEVRLVCFACGRERCHGWCGCEEGTDG